MQNITLGTSPLTCSRLAYGCWRLAGSEGGPRHEDAVGIAAVRAAYEAGYTLFDNADIYGRGECERIFGKAMRDTPGMRERIVLATKCGSARRGMGARTATIRRRRTSSHPSKAR